MVALGYAAGTVGPDAIGTEAAVALNDGFLEHPGVLLTALVPHLLGSFLGLLLFAIAAAFHWTLQTDDPLFKGASGFQLGSTIDYQPFSWLSMPIRFFGEDRDWQYNGRFRVYSISPGLAFRTDWQSVDRIELIYSRRFYSSSVDDNPARPLDKHVLALGAYINF